MQAESEDSYENKPTELLKKPSDLQVFNMLTVNQRPTTHVSSAGM